MELISLPPDKAKMEAAADAARLAEMLGEPLDETAQRILAYEYPMSCSHGQHAEKFVRNGPFAVMEDGTVI